MACAAAFTLQAALVFALLAAGQAVRPGVASIGSAVTAVAAATSDADPALTLEKKKKKDDDDGKKDKHPYTSPTGLFIQVPVGAVEGACRGNVVALR